MSSLTAAGRHRLTAKKENHKNQFLHSQLKTASLAYPMSDMQSYNAYVIIRKNHTHEKEAKHSIS